jgi:hypothetical protein
VWCQPFHNYWVNHLIEWNACWNISDKSISL